MKRVDLDCGLTMFMEGKSGIIQNPDDMKEKCSYCGEADCYADCDGSQGDIDGLESQIQTEDRRTFNAIIDGVQSLILAHWCAGIDVESPEYQEGIKTALDAIQNNYGI